MKSNRNFIIGMLLLLSLLVYLETIAPKQTDWRPTFSARDKIPFGTWVLRNSLDDLFPGKRVHEIDRSFYEDLDTDSAACDILVITSNFAPDTLDMLALMDKVDLGSTALIAADYWPKSFTDTLGVVLNQIKTNVLDTVSHLQTKSGKGWGPSYTFKKLIQNSWFEVPDSGKIVVLGRENEKANFIKVPFGNGMFLLHAQPLAFTNYHILYNEHQYLEEVLAWLGSPERQLDWDEYYKPFRTESGSPIRVILSIAPLRAAYWTLIIGLILYIVTNFRRRQRPIPLIRPKANYSLDFVNTIGQLYFNQKNHKDLTTKIFTAFSEYISSKYFIRIEFTDDFYRRLSAKSGVDLQIVTMIFTAYQTLAGKTRISEEELFRFNELVEQFYRQSRQSESVSTLN